MSKKVIPGYEGFLIDEAGNWTINGVSIAEQRLVGRITGGLITALTGANTLLAMGIGAIIAEIDLLDLAGMTAGELLVATGAASAAWQSTGVKLSAPDISGSVTAASALTLPAHSVGGTLAMGANNITLDATQTVDGVDVSAHDANTTTAHGAVSAATASKHVVRDASARAKFAQSAAAGDAIVADANNRAPNATLLEGSSKATVQDHIPKAHSIASHNDTTGTGAELDELTDGSQTTLHSHAAAGGGIWTLYETLSPDGDATISTSTLDAHDLWMVILDFTVTAGGEQSFSLRINGGSSGYSFRRLIHNAVQTVSNTQQYILGEVRDDFASLGVVYIMGRSQGDNGVLSILGGTGSEMTANIAINGYYDAAADLTSMTFFLGDETFTGKIKIYYMDY